MSWIAGGLLLAGVLAVGAALTLQWWLLPVASTVILGVAFFYASSTWQIRNLLDGRGSAEIVWRLLPLDSHARYVCVESGLRGTGLHLSRKLQRGTLKVIDVYNPQQMTERHLWRLREVAREEVPHDGSDPRGVWMEGSIDRLPQRDASVPAVVFDQVLSALGHHGNGDHGRVLREAYRILEPGGQLVVVDAIRPKGNPLAIGDWFSAEELNTIIRDSHFLLHDDVKINDLLRAIVAIKPMPRPEQLAFKF